MKLYAAAITARRMTWTETEYTLNVITLLASSDAHADQIARLVCSTRYPPEQGYYGNGVAITTVTDDAYRDDDRYPR